MPGSSPSSVNSSTGSSSSSSGQKGSSSSNTGMVAGIASGVAGAATLAAAAAGIILLRRRQRRSKQDGVGKHTSGGSESKAGTPCSDGSRHSAAPFVANGISRSGGSVPQGSAYKPSNGGPRVALEAVFVPGGVPGSQARPIWGGTAVAPSGEETLTCGPASLVAWSPPDSPALHTGPRLGGRN